MSHIPSSSETDEAGDGDRSATSRLPLNVVFSIPGLGRITGPNEEIGGGSEGKVVAAILITEAGLSISVVVKTSRNLGLLRDSENLQNIPPHENVIKVYGICAIPQLGRQCSCVILERAAMSLQDKMDKYPEFWASCTLGDLVRMFIDIFRGLLHLHKHQIMHGDLKPANVLSALDETHKVADFGFAVIKAESKKYVSPRGCGTVPYSSPELILRFSENRDSIKRSAPLINVDLSSDVYSGGMLMLTILNFAFLGSKSPLEDLAQDTDRHVLLHTETKCYKIKCLFPEELRHLIEGCLQFNLLDSITGETCFGRPSCEEILGELEDMLKKEWAWETVASYKQRFNSNPGHTVRQPGAHSEDVNDVNDSPESNANLDQAATSLNWPPFPRLSDFIGVISQYPHNPWENQSRSNMEQLMERMAQRFEQRLQRIEEVVQALLHQRQKQKKD